MDDETILRVPDLTAGAQRILQVASELFYRHGIHAVGVDTIAAESGITKRTLYDRFGSKDRLVAVYLQARHTAWWGRLQQRIAEAPVPRALAVFGAYSEDPLPTDRGCAFLNAAGELPIDHPAQPVIRAHKRMLRRLLADLVRQDRLGLDADVTADELFLLLEGAIAHRGIDEGRSLMVAARRAAEERLRES